ncbi:MAG TPA: GNAT family N-acetyltransferase [Gaiellaceae bacterium]|nr:GNAT family N-acetyltransferase [Gaiellaceae bacterium]
MSVELDIVIRPPNPEDAEGLALAARDLAGQYMAHEPERFRVPNRDAQLAAINAMLRSARAENEVWLVAEVGGEAVGDACAHLLEPSADAAVEPQLDVGRRRAYLDYLAVQAQHRGQGIGGRLLQAVEQWAREHGAELISTDTNLRSNLGAVEFYEKHGYDKQAVVLRKPLR